MSLSDLANRLAERALELVRIPSVYGDEGALADYMEKWAQGHDLHVHRDGHALLIGELQSEKPTIALTGHLDTVAPPEGEIPEARLDGDRIVGLGSSDMKGGLAVACALVEDVKSSPYNMVLAFYDKEEGPHEANGMGRLIPRMNDIALAFVMEPTNGTVQLGCVGSMHATVTFAGKAAHSARPWLGDNAIHKAGRFLSELGGREREVVTFDGLEYYEVINATLAQGGTGRTTIPARFELNVNYRFAPGRSLEQAEAFIRDLVGSDAEIEITDRAPAGRVCLDNEHVQKLLQSGDLMVEPKQAWTDVARLTEAGIDAVNFGPGETAQAHQAGESAPIAELATVYEALHSFLSS